MELECNQIFLTHLEYNNKYMGIFLKLMTILLLYIVLSLNKWDVLCIIASNKNL
jgi:hypothetical protein